MRRTIFHIIICLFAYLLLGLTHQTALAAGNNWTTGDFFGIATHDAATKQGASSNEAFAKSNGYNTVQTIGEMVGGCIMIPEIQQIDPKYCQGLGGKSALGGVNTLIYAMVTSPPASTNLALLDMGVSLGFIPKQALAQGIGFTGLQPLLPIWKGFRNIAYSILAILMIVIGFMVMFRKKIDPKTVVTVQNALPRIVMTLILITFSYAIVGFLIDLMYVVTALGIAMLAPAGYKIGAGLPGGGFSQPTGAVQNFYLNQADPFSGGFFALFSGVFGPLINLVNPFSGAFSTVATGAQTAMGGNVLFGLAQIASGGKDVGGFVLGVLLSVIVLVAFLIGFVRIFFMLLSSYVQIIFSLMIGPLQILLDAIPGGNGFSSWIKNLIMNLIPFPITILVLIIANWLGSSGISSTTAAGGGLNNLWIPPLLPQPALGGGGAVSNFAYTIIWLGLIMSIPSIVGSIKEALKSKAAVPTGVGAIVGPLGAGAGMVFQTAYQGSFIWNALKHKDDEGSKLEKLLPKK